MGPGFGTKFLTHGAATLMGALTCYAVVTKQNSVKTVLKSMEKPKDGNNKNIKGETCEMETFSAMAPTSPVTMFKPNPDMLIAFDSRTKNPAFVMERLPKRGHATNNKASRQGLVFREEKNLPEYHRSRNGYYRNSGFDRGHLAPAADFPHSQEAMKDTFSLSNISPQFAVFNRVVWSRLESLVRKLAKEVEHNAGDLSEVETYVVTGPLWLPQRLLSPSDTEEHLKQQQQQQQQQQQRRDWFQYEHIGFGSPPSLVQVPSHFFKFVCAVSRRGEKNTIIHFAAFVLPNSNFEEYEEINLKDYLVRPSDLEAVSGLQFFPNLRKVLQSDSGSSIVSVPGKLGDQTESGTLCDLQVWDLVTEGVWMEHLPRSHQKTMAEEDALLFDSVDSMSKSRKAKSRAALRKKQNDFPIELQHLCKNHECNDIIRLKK